MNDYSEKYNDPRWQRKRLEIFSRDNWSCLNCGDATSELAVHHKKYYDGKAPWEYDDSNLITLCINCHEGEHEIDGSQPLARAIDDAINKFEAFATNKSQVPYLITGFAALDYLTRGLRKEEISLLASRPQMEQFSFAFAIVKNMASCGGQSCGIISIDKRLTRIGTESQCSFAKINLSRIESGFFSMEDWEKVVDVAEMLSGLPILIDDSHFCSAHQLIRRIKKWKRDKNVEFVIIDYLELISSNPFELTEVIRQLKILSKEIDVHIMIISHCDRKLESRTNKRFIRLKRTL